MTQAHCASLAFDYRDDFYLLKCAYRARNADQEVRDGISERFGIRWSVLDILAGWLPAFSSPPDPMHGAYLGRCLFRRFCGLTHLSLA